MKKIWYKLLAGALVFMSALLFSGCRTQPQAYRTAQNGFFSDGYYLCAYTENEGAFTRLRQAAEEELQTLSALFDRSNFSSGCRNLCDLCLASGQKAVELPAEAMDFLKECLAWQNATGGAFSLVENGGVWYDASTSRAMLTTPGSILACDFAAEGYAARETAALLEKMGCADYYLRVGRAVACKGAPGGAAGWPDGMGGLLPREGAAQAVFSRHNEVLYITLTGSTDALAAAVLAQGCCALPQDFAQTMAQSFSASLTRAPSPDR
ncbi:MAG: hypothetical protein Q4G07_02295 [Oscillospiraceae bacterium]|nr:hypothetical protein [Oscillospiraceae bacterium]